MEKIFALINQMEADGVISRFVEQGALNGEKFEDVLRQHQLLETWHDFQQRYLHP